MLNQTLEAKLLDLIYHRTRNYKKPLQPDPSRLSHNLDTTEDAIKQALNRLRRKGQIKKTDQYGNALPSRVSAERRLIKLLIENHGTLPWDRQHRIGIARQLNIKLTSLRKVKYNIDHLLHTEYGEHSRQPLQIMLLDLAEAEVYLDEDDQEIKYHKSDIQWKYVSGYRKPRLKCSPCKAPRRTLKHRILIHLVNSGGTVTSPASRQARYIGCKRRSYERAVSQLVTGGLVTKSANGLFVRDAERSASFLAQIGLCPTRPFSTANPSPPRPSSAVAVSNRFNRYQIPSVSVVNQSPLPSILTNETTVTRMLLWNLIIRRQLQTAIAQRMVWYAQNYEQGGTVIMNLKQRLNAADKSDSEVLRQARGQLWAVQKEICFDLLNKLKDYLKLGGVIADALTAETATRVQWALPALDLTERNLVGEMSEWLDFFLPVDSQPQEWVLSFIEHSHSATLSEFVCRGGLDLLFRIKAWNDAERGFVDQRIAWDILAYMAYIEINPFNYKYPDQFPNITSWDGLKTQESYWNGQVVQLALSYYMGFYEYKLGSIKQLQGLICKAICSEYPVRNEEGALFFISVWQQPGIHNELCEHEEYGVLRQWVKGYGEANKPTEKHGIPKYSLRWYENHLRAIEKYGLPGDIEAVRIKVSALRRWGKATVDEQKQKLVPQLNRPEKYSDPRLPWQAWDMIARGEMLDDICLDPADLEDHSEDYDLGDE